jgi:hypothetical protein
VKPKEERLRTAAAVKGTMVEAHLEWAAGKLANVAKDLAPHLTPESAVFVTGQVLATDWIPLHCLIAIDRAIAAAVGQPPEVVFRELGRHSAERNLRGVYKNFAKDEPHLFFEKQALLHPRFQNFGKSVYLKTGSRSGRISLEECEEFSPVFCLSGAGYYEAALELMKVPGPVQVVESSCRCAGDAACIYDLSW